MVSLFQPLSCRSSEQHVVNLNTEFTFIPRAQDSSQALYSVLKEALWPSEVAVLVHSVGLAWLPGACPARVSSSRHHASSDCPHGTCCVALARLLFCSLLPWSTDDASDGQEGRYCSHSSLQVRRCGVCILNRKHGQFRAPGHRRLSEHYHGPRPALDHQSPWST